MSDCFPSLEKVVFGCFADDLLCSVVYAVIFLLGLREGVYLDVLEWSLDLVHCSFQFRLSSQRQAAGDFFLLILFFLIVRDVSYLLVVSSLWWYFIGFLNQDLI